MENNKNVKELKNAEHSLSEFNDAPIQGSMAILESTKGEYEYLQKAREGLHTRVGILIALLSGLVSATLITEAPGFIDLFKSNIIIAHFRVICSAALLISFSISLIFYVRVFLVRNHYVFTYQKFTDAPIEVIRASHNEELIMRIYREYANCIDHNQKVYDKTVSIYTTGNKWLIVTIAFTIASIIINLF